MSSKKAVITILGLAGGRYDKEKGPINFNSQHYYYQDGKKNKKKLYSNTLPYFIDTYGEEYDIVPIYTKEAKELQSKILLENENKSEWISIFDRGYKIEDENDFNQVLETINEAISAYDKVIFDVTHGFRHLPILAIVNLIIQNIKDSEKIESILFGKEIIKADQATTGEYDIIRLDNYLDLAKLSFVLTSFNTNYTVGNKLIFKNDEYQKVTDSLRKVSSHILANSIQTLIMGESSLINKTIDKLKLLLFKDQNIKTFTTYIDEIIEHLNEIQELEKEINYVKLFKLSKMMKEREYLLNSITLLNESVGMFCSEKIRSMNNNISQHIDNYLKYEEGNLYELAHHSKNIIKRTMEFKGDYLYEPTKAKLTAGQKSSLQKKKQNLKKKIPDILIKEIEKHGFKIELSVVDKNNKSNIKNMILDELDKQNNDELIDLISKIENLRNNLAHGNTSDKIENVKYAISKLSSEYEGILNHFETGIKKSKIASVSNSIEKKLLNNVKKIRKIKPTGIDAPKEKIINLTDKFNNR